MDTGKPDICYTMCMHRPRSVLTAVAGAVTIAALAVLTASPAQAAGFGHGVAAQQASDGTVTIRVTGVAKARPVTVKWTASDVSRVTSGCSAAKAKASPGKCTGTASHRFEPGTYTIALVDGSRSFLARIRVTEAFRPLPVGWQDQMLTLVNAERSRNGVAPLSFCGALTAAAGDYAALEASTGHYDHTGPDGSTPDMRVIAAGYDPTGLGENIALGSVTVADVVAGWIASPHHHATMIDPSYSHVGFGAADSPDNRRYWVQDYGYGTCPN